VHGDFANARREFLQKPGFFCLIHAICFLPTRVLQIKCRDTPHILQCKWTLARREVIGREIGGQPASIDRHVSSRDSLAWFVVNTNTTMRAIQAASEIKSLMTTRLQ
jgi:hypothetical protein